jgi:nitrate/TMAO reductase-like tetraheme cytochrome c subunit
MALDRVTDLPAASRNPISIAGVWLTTLSALAFLTFFVMEAFDLIATPYGGLLGFVLIPAMFVVGLLLIPFGIWRENRRRRSGKEAWAWPAIDLAQARTRKVAAAIFLLTVVNLAIVATATVGALHYMETTSFCGQVCHTPMKPEFTAHAASPHAGVPCVACHVGPGAKGLIQSKMNGARQMFELFMNSYSRPIPVPARNMPSPAGTCVRCHTIDKMPAERTMVKREYDEDEANTETASPLVMYTKAVHWHAQPDVNVEFVAADAQRTAIPYVRLTTGGQTTEFLGEGVTARPAGELRRMDCLDCHSRPAHTMSASAELSVNQAIADGSISQELPFVRKEAVEALKVAYPNEEAASQALRKRMSDLYGSTKPAALVTAAGDTLVRLYRTNVFPDMKVTWGTYVSYLGHADLSGCFRCHDDSHKAASGKLIRQDCALCHKTD